jgi:hypothetical protein
MDPATLAILGIVAVMALNHLSMYLGALKGPRGLFLALQAINLGVACAVIWYGLPGFEHLDRPGVPMGRVVAWFLGLVLVLRTVQNTQARAAWLRERLADRRRTERGRADAIRASIVDGTDGEEEE